VKWYRSSQIALYALLGIAAVACFIASVGCSSTTDATFQETDERLVPFAIPVPPAELTCSRPSDLQHRATTLEEVEEDGSVMIRALTVDVLALLQNAMESYNECVASNEARQVVIRAAKEAQARLEAMLAEAQ